MPRNTFSSRIDSVSCVRLGRYYILRIICSAKASFQNGQNLGPAVSSACSMQNQYEFLFHLTVVHQFFHYLEMYLFGS